MGEQTVVPERTGMNGMAVPNVHPDSGSVTMDSASMLWELDVTVIETATMGVMNAIATTALVGTPK